MKIERKHKRIFNFIIASILFLTLVNVSLAWYSYSTRVSTDPTNLKVAKWDFVVSLTSGGEPISITDHIQMNVSDFVNVKKGKMAPGTSGKINLYITSNSDVISMYQIRIDKSKLKLIVHDSSDSEHDYSDILQSHIVFYSLDESGSKKIITNDTFFEGNLESGIEKHVVVYWEWLYEPDVSMIEDEEEKIQIINQYDEEDTLIGEHSNAITGGIELDVQGTQRKPVEP